MQDNVAFHVYGNCYYLEVSRLIAYVCCNNSFAGCQIALQTAAHATLALATVKNLSHRHEQPFGAVCKLFLLAAGLAKQLSGNVLVFRMELRSTTGSSTTLPALYTLLVCRLVDMIKQAHCTFRCVLLTVLRQVFPNALGGCLVWAHRRPLNLVYWLS